MEVDRFSVSMLKTDRKLHADRVRPTKTPSGCSAHSEKSKAKRTLLPPTCYKPRYSHRDAGTCKNSIIITSQCVLDNSCKWFTSKVPYLAHHPLKGGINEITIHCFVLFARYYIAINSIPVLICGHYPMNPRRASCFVVTSEVVSRSKILQKDFLSGFKHAVFIVNAIKWIVSVVSPIWIRCAKWIHV